MNKLAVSLFLIAITLLATACENKINDDTVLKKSSVINTKDEIKSNKKKGIIKIPINIGHEEEKNIKYLEIDENSSLQEKMKIIIDTISIECFNGLEMKATVYGKNRAKIELIESEDPNKSRVSWKEDYLNEYTKEYTINTIIKNIIQEEYKGEWIEKVQLYYEDELIPLD